MWNKPAIIFVDKYKNVTTACVYKLVLTHVSEHTVETKTYSCEQPWPNLMPLLIYCSLVVLGYIIEP